MKHVWATKQLKLRLDMQNTLSKVALRYMSREHCPIRPKIKWLSETRDKDTLWWRVSTTEIIDLGRVVRSWHSRRARKAFEEELKARGFDSKGRKLPSNMQGLVTADQFHGNMKGTAILQLRRLSLQENFTTMRQEVKTLVDKLVKVQLENQGKQSRDSEILNGRRKSGGFHPTRKKMEASSGRAQRGRYE
ncbi:hypothetical protein BJY00DRAFT_276424 [Aspergillus carlsbadensis]|nr:hypothetical protein BJY00DRAFT_276424 [Aspergillus carlsbadensis]